MSSTKKDKKWRLGFIESFAEKGGYKTSGEQMGEQSFSRDEVSEGKGLAILAYIPFLCFIPFLKGKTLNQFAYQHGKQGVMLFLFEMLIVISMLFWKVALFLACIVALFGVLNAVSYTHLTLPTN